MKTWLGRINKAHLMSEAAIYPNETLADRLTLLLRVAGSERTVLSDPGTHHAAAAFEYVQLKFFNLSRWNCFGYV